MWTVRSTPSPAPSARTAGTQDIELTVDRVADTSITLDGRGGSDQYHVALGLGTFLNVTVADSDPSTQIRWS